MQLFILPRDEHLRQAALDAEVQAKVAQQELEEDCQAESS
jgi:phage gp46-like protein